MQGQEALETMIEGNRWRSCEFALFIIFVQHAWHRDKWLLLPGPQTQDGHCW